MSENRPQKVSERASQHKETEQAQRPLGPKQPQQQRGHSRKGNGLRHLDTVGGALIEERGSLLASEGTTALERLGRDLKGTEEKAKGTQLLTWPRAVSESGAAQTGTILNVIKVKCGD